MKIEQLKIAIIVHSIFELFILTPDVSIRVGGVVII